MIEPRYRRVARIPWRKLDQQTVIVDPRSRKVHVLNGTGSELWDLLAEERSLDELRRALERQGQFAVGEEQLVRDIAAFLADLNERGLVDLDPGAAGSP